MGPLSWHCELCSSHSNNRLYSAFRRSTSFVSVQTKNRLFGWSVMCFVDTALGVRVLNFHHKQFSIWDYRFRFTSALFISCISRQSFGLFLLEEEKYRITLQLILTLYYFNSSNPTFYSLCTYNIKKLPLHPEVEGISMMELLPKSCCISPLR